MLELFDSVLRGSSLSGKLENFLLDSFVFKTLGYELTNEKLLLFNKILKCLLVLLRIFNELLNEFFSALDLSVKLLIQVNNTHVQVLLALELFVLLVDLFHKIFASVLILLSLLLKDFYIFNTLCVIFSKILEFLLILLNGNLVIFVV